MILAFDPGARYFGWAAISVVGRSSPRLWVCGKVKAGPEHHRLAGVWFGPDFLDADVVIELPQAYRQSKSKGDPNDLIDVAVMVGRIVEMAATARTVRLVRPRAWKGTVPGDVFTERIKSRLDPAELELTNGHDHNVIDAVGLGLWAAGRRGIGVGR